MTWVAGFWGAGFWIAGFWAGLGSHYDLSVGARISVYNSNGTFKSLLQSGSSSLSAVTFRHADGGCADFSLDFADYVDIEKADKIKIRLFNDETVFFYGVVRNAPIRGSTATKYSYSGYGLNDYLVRLNTESLSYVGKTLQFILEDLADNVIAVKSSITSDHAKIVPPNITVTSMTVNYVKVSDVLSALKKIADSDGDEYLYGVDVDGDFFFRARSAALKATLVVGKRGPNGIAAYEPTDATEARTRLFVLRNDGTYLTTITSTLVNDVYEDKVTGPKDADDADVTLWATGQLLNMERTPRSASVEWPITETPIDLIIADGFVRVLSSRPPTKAHLVRLAWGDGYWGSDVWDGEVYTGYDLDDTLSIKEVAYSVSATEAMRKISLGALPLRIEDVIRDIDRKVTDLEVTLGV